MSNFLNSLKTGSAGESLVLELFSKHEIYAELLNEKHYDIAFTLGDDDWRHIEVKYDVMAAKTGNLAIETFNPKSNMKSGLSLTKAEIWAVVLTDPISIFFTETKKLRKFLKTEKPFKSIACGGDKNAKLEIYKKDHILRIFQQVDNLEKDDFICLVKQMAKI